MNFFDGFAIGVVLIAGAPFLLFLFQLFMAVMNAHPNIMGALIFGPLAIAFAMSFVKEYRRKHNV